MYKRRQITENDEVTYISGPWTPADETSNANCANVNENGPIPSKVIASDLQNGESSINCQGENGE